MRNTTGWSVHSRWSVFVRLKSLERLTPSFRRINSQLIDLPFVSSNVTNPHIDVQIRRMWANSLGVTQGVLETLRCSVVKSII